MKIAGIGFQEGLPSIVSNAQLYCWTKYSVGKPVGGEYRYGAVKPPDSNCDWLPAAVSSHTVLIACLKFFRTPEEAVDWLQSAA
jgi:hypothetical protein